MAKISVRQFGGGLQFLRFNSDTGEGRASFDDEITHDLPRSVYVAGQIADVLRGALERKVSFEDIALKVEDIEDEENTSFRFKLVD